MSKNIIAILVENKFGVLARVAGLFSARGFNINSLAVGETEDPHISRMTIVAEADKKILEQIKKQLNKLINVIRVEDLTGGEYVDRELILIKVKAENTTIREKILQIISSTGAEIADTGKKSVIVEESSDEHKIKALIELLRPYGIIEIVRTGKIALKTSDDINE